MSSLGIGFILQHLSSAHFVLVVSILKVVGAIQNSIWHEQGPVFIYEPPGTADFMNDTGITIDCSVHGYPDPRIEWLDVEDDVVASVPEVLNVLKNGSLHFSSFASKDYRQDFHANSFRCTASNIYGTIVSRRVKVRAVVRQPYQVQVYDEYVIRGNTAVLRCHIPSFVSDYVKVISWVTENNVIIKATKRPNELGRYSVLGSGHLHIRNVDRGDNMGLHWCITRHRLTEEIRRSDTAGRLEVKEARGSIPPRMTHYEMNINANAGHLIELPCAAQAYPVPEYRWYFGNRRKPLATNSRLVQLSGSLFIDDVGPDDGGQYSCVVNSSVGSHSVKTTVVVTAPLTVYVEPQTQIVNAGREALLSCTINGYPVNFVSWTKNGQQIRKIGAKEIVSPTYLRIEELTRKDSGMYQCFAENNEMQSQGTSQLNLGKEVPLLIESFEPLVVQPHASMTLKCIFAGNPKPSVNWLLDGTIIDGPDDKYIRSDYVNDRGLTVSYLNITNIESQDGGRYSCTGSNGRESSSYSARIDVYGPPGVRPLKNTSVVNGETAHLLCQVFGYPIESIKWLRDGAELLKNSRSEGYENGSLIIRNVTPNMDNGQYTCIARNKNKMAARASMWLSIKVAPSIDEMTSRIVDEGHTVTLMCSILAGDRPISKRWFKDGHHVPKNLGISTTEAEVFSALVINSVQHVHVGNYTCVASNRVGSDNKTASINVRMEPEWMFKPTDVTVPEYSKVVLPCSGNGFPPPVAKWYISKGDLKEEINNSSGKIVFGNGTLLLKNVTSEERYSCTIHNGVKNDKSSAVFISITGSPNIKISSTSKTVKLKKSLKIICNVYGSNRIKIRWYRNKELLNERKQKSFQIKEYGSLRDLTSELIIGEARRSDEAEYTCIAKNNHGEYKESINITVLKPPVRPSSLKITELTNSSLVSISWAKTTDKLQIMEYLVQIKIDKAENWSDNERNLSVPGHLLSTTVDGFLRDRNYEIRVLARNEVGFSVPSESLLLSSNSKGNFIIEMSNSPKSTTAENANFIAVTVLIIIIVLLAVILVIATAYCCRQKIHRMRRLKGKFRTEIKNGILDDVDQYGKLSTSAMTARTGSTVKTPPDLFTYNATETYYDDVSPYATFRVPEVTKDLKQSTELSTFQQSKDLSTIT